MEQKIIWYSRKTGAITQEQKELQAEKESGQKKQVEQNVIGVYPNYVLQEMDGYGCAMTESAAYVLQNMKPEQRKKALNAWFGKDGINASFVRVPIDSCDYALSEYQAVEDPIADPDFTTFSISRDKKYIIPVLKEIMEIRQGKLEVLLTPWSPPAAWKTAPEIVENDAAVYGGSAEKRDFTKPGRSFGGRLRPEYYGAWARYLVKYIRAYREEGIPVTMLSIQNETNAATDWDSCVWSGKEIKIFLTHYLYPELSACGLQKEIQIFIWDHNKERMLEHLEQVMDENTSEMIRGFAYHWYSGDHFEALSLAAQKYPGKILMHSESCPIHLPEKAVFYDVPEKERRKLSPEQQKLFEIPAAEVNYQDAVDYAHDILGDLNHGMNRWIEWNAILDWKGGPRHVGGGFGSILLSEEDGSCKILPAYEYVKLIAQTVKPGAKRIGISFCDDGIEGTAVKNTDGSIGIVLLNSKEKDRKITIRICGYLIPIQLAAHTLSSVNMRADIVE